MSLRNKKDFREAVLQALDVTDDKDVENEYNFKSAVLEAMGVEFVPADLRDFEIYRAKLVEGIGNMSSGGGGSSDWTKAIVRVKNNSSTALLNVKLDTFENDGFISAFLFKATIGVDTNAESIIYEANTDKTDIYYIYKNAYIILYALSIADPEAFQVEGLAEILTIPEAPPFIKVTGDCTITINDADAQ